MADQAPVAGLVLFIDDDTARFQQGMRRSQQIVEESSNRMQRSLQNIDKAQRGVNNTMGRFDASAFRNTAREILFAENGVKRLQSSFVLLAGTVAGFSTAQMSMQLGKVADQYTTIRNRIATVVDGQKQQAAAEQSIFDIAQRSRSAFESTATMYARLSAAVPSLARNQADLLRVIETVQKSFVVGGATTQEAQSAAVQLAQGLASGRLQGDELRSILENNIPLARALADALSDGDIGRLREMGSEGLLTADKVVQAILSGTAKIDQQFARTIPRISDGWQAIDNAFTRYVGQLDKSLGASEKMARGLMHIAENFEAIGRAAGYAAAAIAAVMLARRAGSLIAAPVMNVAGGAMRDRRYAAAQALELRAAAEMRRDFAEREARAAREQADKMAATSTWNRAPKADQAEFSRAAARVDAARAAADKASAAEIANIEKRIALEGKSVGATAAVTKAQESLNKALKARSDLMVKAQGDGGVSRRTQNRAYSALFDEAAAREQLAKADSHLRSLEERGRKINDTVRKLESGTPAQQRAMPMFSKQAAENAAGRVEAEKAVEDARKGVETAMRRSERAAENLDKERLKRTTDVGRSLVAAEKEVGSARKALADAQLAQESARLNQQAALDAKAVALRQARVTAEKQLATAQQALAGASQAVGVGAQGALNASAKAVADADARVAAIKREEAALASAHTMAVSRTSVLAQSMAGVGAVGMSAFRGLVAFLGGPWGVALTAGTAALGYFAYSQAEAAAAAEKHKASLESLKTAMETLNKTPGIDPDALLKLKAELPAAIEGVKASLASLANTVPSGLSGMFNGVGREISTQLHEAGVATYGFQQKLRELTPGSKETESALKTLIEELYRLSGTAPPNFSAHIAEMMRAAQAALMMSRAVREGQAALANASTAGGVAGKQLSARELREGSSGWTQADQSIAKAAGYTREFTEEQKKAVEASDKFNAKRTEELYLNGLIIAGREREADVQKEMNKLRDAMGPLYKPEDYDRLRKEAETVVDMEKRLKDFRDSEKKGGAADKKEANFLERIERLKEQGKAAFFTDLDRQVVDELKNMRASPELMAATTAALEAGKELPAKAKEIRDALMLKEAGAEYRTLLTSYGTMEQLLPTITDYQAKLNMMVQMGKLSADQAGIAFADYLTKFQAFKWIDTTADAFGKFAESATMDFKNIGSAFETLMKDIQRMLIQEFVAGPIRRLVKSAITDMFTPAGGAGGILNQIMGGLGIGGGVASSAMSSSGINTVGIGALYHTGGVAGGPGSGYRVMPMSTWDHAQRFHSGKLGPREIPAILERNETVRTVGQERRLQQTFSALAEAKGAQGGGGTNVEIHPAPGTAPETRRRRGPDGMEQIVILFKKIMGDDLQGNGDIAQMLQSRYGLNRVAGRGG